MKHNYALKPNPNNELVVLTRWEYTILNCSRGSLYAFVHRTIEEHSCKMRFMRSKNGRYFVNAGVGRLNEAGGRIAYAITASEVIG